MGWLSIFGSKQRREEVIAKIVPIKLIEPNYGRLVTLEITEPNETYANMDKGLIEAYLTGMEQVGVKWSSEGRIYHIECDEGTIAETIREAFK